MQKSLRCEGTASSCDQVVRLVQERNYILELLARSRTRQSWNDRLEHWERPASDSEEAMIGRAASMVRQVMSADPWFVAEGVQIEQQGSYYNNTNVRKESDIDLRAVHPDIHIQYGPGVRESDAYRAFGYHGTGKTYIDSLARLRRQIVMQLGSRFGGNIDASGRKAIRVNGIPGSRATVDIAPCFVLDRIGQNPLTSRYWQVKGVTILCTDGSWTFSFPDQHHANGVAKRTRTRLRFKKIVRMAKRLRDELVQQGAIRAKEVPSFLVESLVYGVEDEAFLVESGDRYDRLQRVMSRINAQLHDAAWCNSATDITKLENLFGNDKGWTAASARQFAHAALQRLNAA
jgi:hypothetical protein